jgi:creatinine amidohydrolase
MTNPLTAPLGRLALRLAFGLAAAGAAGAQAPLPVKWDELLATDFPAAIQKAQGTCLLPIGVIEKHGPHLPLGTDVINVRQAAIRGAELEYAIVFPEYYFGQIFEARHQPGTVAYSARLQLDVLQETADEMARNGCKKVVLVNGHGGNNHLLPYFAQSQLDRPRDYVVYVCSGGARSTAPERTRTPPSADGHAGVSETSRVMASRPELVRMDRAESQSGADLKRQDLPQGVFTGIFWYARFPEHYAGDASGAQRPIGELDLKASADSIASVIRSVKADRVSLRLQNEFQEKARRPLDTRQ